MTFRGYVHTGFLPALLLYDTFAEEPHPGITKKEGPDISGSSSELIYFAMAATSAAKSSVFFSMPSPTLYLTKHTTSAPFSFRYWPTFLS